ncbi:MULTISPECIES: hypothetical protein [unclassified Micromonospora]|uniref:hypothetical protein n=1 Tax=unclassified Micromonospora TaxID=2617518 RepID=UPI002FF0624C
MDISPILAAVLGLGATAASGTLVEWARSWLRRRSRVEVRVGDSTLQIASATPEQVRHAVELWVHGAAERRVEDDGRDIELSVEIENVTSALLRSADQLQKIMARTQQLKDTTAELIAKAEQAESLAALHEDEARRIAAVLGEQSNEAFQAQVAVLKDEIVRLQTEHAAELRRVQAASIRSSWLFFVGGLLAAVPVGLLGSWLAKLLGWN